MHDVGEIEVPEVQAKSGDSVAVLTVKMIIREMIALKPKSRPNAHELLDRFTRLCSPHKDVWEKFDGEQLVFLFHVMSHENVTK
jgi:hypothetical protein